MILRGGNGTKVFVGTPCIDAHREAQLVPTEEAKWGVIAHEEAPSITSSAAENVFKRATELTHAWHVV